MRKIFCDRCEKEIKGNAFEIGFHEKPDAFGRNTMNGAATNIISNQKRQLKEYCEDCIILINQMLENKILGMTTETMEMTENRIFLDKSEEYINKLAAAEKALQIELTPLQKQYLVFPYLRQTGKTTAKIIDVLISENKNTKIFLSKEDSEEHIKEYPEKTKILTIEDFVEPEMKNNINYRNPLKQKIIDIYMKLKAANIEVPELILKVTDIKNTEMFLKAANKEVE